MGPSPPPPSPSPSSAATGPVLLLPTKPSALSSSTPLKAGSTTVPELRCWQKLEGAKELEELKLKLEEGSSAAGSEPLLLLLPLLLLPKLMLKEAEELEELKLKLNDMAMNGV